MTDTHPKVVRVGEDGHREGAGRTTALPVCGCAAEGRAGFGPGRSAAFVGAGSATTAARAVRHELA
ncbi:hypothetical protein [Streptomyces caniscabiei]|uniref:hypothetical protein n=1 Tax=Streptomyces caniscabiei TaxID=2746961 RepID=UPI00117C6471|nr:hypothetical protein [Streptomyces caniscabiei]